MVRDVVRDVDINRYLQYLLQGRLKIQDVNEGDLPFRSAGMVTRRSTSLPLDILTAANGVEDSDVHETVGFDYLPFRVAFALDSIGWLQGEPSDCLICV